MSNIASPAKLSRQLRRKLMRDLHNDPDVTQEWKLHMAINAASGWRWLVWWRHYRLCRQGERPRAEARRLAKLWLDKHNVQMAKLAKES